MLLETGLASRPHDGSFDDLHLHLRNNHSTDYRSSWEFFDWRENLSRNGIYYDEQLRQISWQDPEGSPRRFSSRVVERSLRRTYSSRRPGPSTWVRLYLVCRPM